MQRIAYWTFALGVTFAVGCANFQDQQIESRNRNWAADSWKAVQGNYACRQHLRDYRDGYLAGYYDIASGGSGCPPCLPPKKYWGVRYQSPEGYAKAQAWFEGFNDGVVVAEQDGIKRWGEVPTAAEIGVHKGCHNGACGTNGCATCGRYGAKTPAPTPPAFQPAPQMAATQPAPTPMPTPVVKTPVRNRVETITVPTAAPDNVEPIDILPVPTSQATPKAPVTTPKVTPVATKAKAPVTTSTSAKPTTLPAKPVVTTVEKVEKVETILPVTPKKSVNEPTTNTHRATPWTPAPTRTLPDAPKPPTIGQKSSTVRYGGQDIEIVSESAVPPAGTRVQRSETQEPRGLFQRPKSR